MGNTLRKYGSKIILSGELSQVPERTKKNSKNQKGSKSEVQNQKVPKMWYRTIFGSIKNFFGSLSFLEHSFLKIQ